MTKSNKFFTADHHFGHKAIIRYSNRPFANIWEMNQSLVDRWNEVVGKDDEVYHLGDLVFGSRKTLKHIIESLNGKIHLIKGNHDKNIRGWVKDLFASVSNYKEINMDKQKVVLCHFPFRTWNKSHYGAFHLHGHSHGSLGPEGTLRLDVGVDTNDYYPYSWDQVRFILEPRREKLVEEGKILKRGERRST